MKLQANNALRPLGTSDLKEPPLAYGYWRFAARCADSTCKLRPPSSAVSISWTMLISRLDGDGAFGDAELLFGEVLKTQPSSVIESYWRRKVGFYHHYPTIPQMPI